MANQPLVLVVDDERPTVRLLELNLRAEGYEVHTAYNGRQALQQVAEHPPDLIILDVMMPEMDGFEVVARLRRDPHTMQIPVILLTGRRSPQQVVEGWTHDIDLYLTKPYRIEDLLSMARRLLEVAGDQHLM